ncbi:uncharacterized protein LOC105437525 [Strongylocentrotus purpuratus]|uniref:NACHT domain-containing protein n=1 Tax=Strongylocentrotus purpuratus TaxID=7668 RepID=A0A7M7P3U1_STRPU|nr:uncharacterized protein LOC105437525 [Strongylocentrotus purpuratus]
MPVSLSEWRVRIGTFVHWIREYEVKERRERLLKERIRRLKVLCERLEAKIGDSGEESEDDKSRQGDPDPKGCPHTTSNIRSSGNSSDIKNLLTSCDQCIHDLLTASDSHIKEILTPSDTCIKQLLTPRRERLQRIRRLKVLCERLEAKMGDSGEESEDDKSRQDDPDPKGCPHTTSNIRSSGNSSDIKNLLNSCDQCTQDLLTASDSHIKEILAPSDTCIKQLLTPTDSNIRHLLSLTNLCRKDQQTARDSHNEDVTMLTPTDSNIRELITHSDSCFRELHMSADACTDDMLSDSDVKDLLTPRDSAIFEILQPKYYCTNRLLTPKDSFIQTSLPRDSCIEELLTPRDSYIRELLSVNSHNDKSLSPGDGYIQKMFTPRESCTSESLTTGDAYIQESLTQRDSYIQELLTPRDTYTNESLTPGHSYTNKSPTPGDSYIQELLTPRDSYTNKSLTQRHSYTNTSLNPGDSYIQELLALRDFYTNESLTPEDSCTQDSLSPRDSDIRELLTPRDSYTIEPLTQGDSYIQELLTPRDSHTNELLTPTYSYANELLIPGHSFTNTSLAPGDSYTHELLAPRDSYTNEPLTPGDSCTQDFLTPRNSDIRGLLTPRDFYTIESLAQGDSYIQELLTPRDSYTNEPPRPGHSYTNKSLTGVIGLESPRQGDNKSSPTSSLNRDAVQHGPSGGKEMANTSSRSSCHKTDSLKGTVDVMLSQQPYLTELLLVKAGDVELNPGPLHGPIDSVLQENELILLAEEVPVNCYNKLCTGLGFSLTQSQTVLTQHLLNFPGALINFFCRWKVKQRDGTNIRALLGEILKNADMDGLQTKLLKDPILDTSLQNMTEAQVLQCGEELKTFYSEKMCKIKPDPLNFNIIVEFQQIYTNLTLLRNEMGTRQTKTPLDYNDLLTTKINGVLPKRLLVEGEGGVGKTTFCSKIAWDWVNGSPEFQRFSWVLVIPLRNVVKGHTIGDIMKNYLSDSNAVNPKQIDNYILSQPTKVLIVLDGLDEYDGDLSAEESSDISQILRLEKFKECIVLVTTRPWRADQIRSNEESSRSYAFIAIKGFSAENISTYISKYFVNDEKAGSELIRFIEVNDIELLPPW